MNAIFVDVTESGVSKIIGFDGFRFQLLCSSWTRKESSGSSPEWQSSNIYFPVRTRGVTWTNLSKYRLWCSWVFPVFGWYVFRAWRFFAKRAFEMNGDGAVSTYQSVSTKADPTQQEPVDEETTRDGMVSFLSNDALVKCRQTSVVERNCLTCPDIWPYNGGTRQQSCCSTVPPHYWSGDHRWSSSNIRCVGIYRRLQRT